MRFTWNIYSNNFPQPILVPIHSKALSQLTQYVLNRKDVNFQSSHCTKYKKYIDNTSLLFHFDCWYVSNHNAFSIPFILYQSSHVWLQCFHRWRAMGCLKYECNLNQPFPFYKRLLNLITEMWLPTRCYHIDTKTFSISNHFINFLQKFSFF